jgi:nucleotide-binding universal stress UspA family protein
MAKENKKILVCIGNRDASTAAIKYAAIKAKKNKYHIELLTVIDTTGKGFGLFSSIDQVMHDEKREDVEKYMKQAALEVKEYCGITPVINIQEGFVSDEIEEVLNEDKTVNLIVVGAAKGSSSKGKLIASVAEHISNKVFLPLIIVPNNLTEDQLKEIA